MSEKSKEDLEKRVDELEETVKAMLPSRRQAMKGMATAAGAGMLGFGAGNASAQASTSDSDGNVGGPNNRIDVFSDGVDANSVGTGSLSVSGGQVQSVLDGLVVPIGPGFGAKDAIDPSSSSNPVQSALDELSAAGVPRGYVALPQDDVTIAEPSSQPYISAVDGVGIGPIGGYLPKLFFQNVDTGKDWMHFGDVDFATFSFELSGGSTGLNNATGRPIYFPGGAGSELRFPMLNLNGFGAEGIYYDDNSGGDAFAHTYGNIRADNFDAGDAQALFYVLQDSPALAIQTINAYPETSRTASNSDIVYLDAAVGAYADIGSINLGGGSERAFYQRTAGGGSVDYINHLGSASTVVEIDGSSGNGKPVNIGGMLSQGTKDYLLTVGFEAGDFFVGPMQNDGTLNNTKVVVNNALKSQSFVCANSSDVTDNSGSTAGNLSCLGDFTTVA